jgi:hypothetical protein
MNINNKHELLAAIESLETKRQIQEQELVSSFHNVVESLHPSNIIKSAVSNIVPSDFLFNTMKTISRLALGLASSKLTGSMTAGSIGAKWLSSLLNQTAADSVVNNADKIKAYGYAIIHQLFMNPRKAS